MNSDNNPTIHEKFHTLLITTDELRKKFRPKIFTTVTDTRRVNEMIVNSISKYLVRRNPFLAVPSKVFGKSPKNFKTERKGFEVVKIFSIVKIHQCFSSD